MNDLLLQPERALLDFQAARQGQAAPAEGTRAVAATHIRELDSAARAAWDGYLRRTPGALPQQLSGWRDVLTKTYGYETRYLMAQQGERVVGVLPLFVVRSPLVGNTATTMPGGLCADSDDIATALIAGGRDVARRAGLRRFVLQDTRRAWPGPLHTATHHVHVVVDVSAGAEAKWNALDKETRRQVRVARKNGLTVEVDRAGERVGDFHQVMSHFTHQAGTPLFSQRFVERVVESFMGDFSIVVTYKEQQPIGAYFQLMLGDTVFGLWGATRREFLSLKAAYLAHWEILNDAVAGGFRVWDVGRTPRQSDSLEFKHKWGAESRPVYQQVAGGAGSSVSSRVQSDGAFQRFMQLWPKLPLPVATFLGPHLRRHVPFA